MVHDQDCFAFMVMNPACVSSMVVLLSIPIVQCAQKETHADSKHAQEHWNRTFNLGCTRHHLQLGLLASPVTTEAVEVRVHDSTWFYQLYCTTYGDDLNSNKNVMLEIQFCTVLSPFKLFKMCKQSLNTYLILL